MAGATVDPVRFERREVDAFWRAVRAMDEATSRIARTCTRLGDDDDRWSGVEEVSAAVVQVRHTLTEAITTARTAGLPPQSRDGIDVESERWMTAIHEAGHAIVGAALGHRVQYVAVTGDQTGVTRTGEHATGLQEAVIAVAGQVATRAELGREGGAVSDYARAEAALARTGWSVDQAEALAEDVVRIHHRELIALAQRIYRHGRENNIN